MEFVKRLKMIKKVPSVRNPNQYKALNLKVLKQTGHIKSEKRDYSRFAYLPGKRISKAGKIYWETRKNRTDAPMRRL